MIMDDGHLRVNIGVEHHGPCDHASMSMVMQLAMDDERLRVGISAVVWSLTVLL
jgi:hypothetical protein